MTSDSRGGPSLDGQKTTEQMRGHRFSFLGCLLILLVSCLLPKETNGLAAAARKSSGGKKSKQNKRRPAAKGFGAPKPTWQEIAAKYKTRIPPGAYKEEVSCPCGSGLIYKDCCALYHRGEKFPESPIKVLRSRYTAFAWRIIPYIIETSHPTCNDWRENKIAWVKDLNKQGMFDNHEFVSLEAGEEEFTSETEGYIEFKVTMKGEPESEFDGRETTIKERSQFLRDDEGRWSYATGEIQIDELSL